jgi:hypothetical protein
MEPKIPSTIPRHGAIPSVRKPHEEPRGERTLVDAKPLGFIAEREKAER